MRRILIVDDHPLVRMGLASLIDGEPDLAVCGEAGSIEEALEQVPALEPDLAVIDLSLEDGNGLELVKRLKTRYPGTRILVCSMHDEALFAQRVLNAGAMGYINKQEAPGRVIDAIRHVLGGRLWLSRTMSERVLQDLTQQGSGPPAVSPALLSNRELEVFSLIGEGLGPTEIAEHLHLSVKTIETHREKIKRKLRLGSGRELTRFAVQWTLEQA